MQCISITRKLGRKNPVHILTHFELSAVFPSHFFFYIQYCLFDTYANYDWLLGLIQPTTAVFSNWCIYQIVCLLECPMQKSANYFIDKMQNREKLKT